MMSDNWKHIVFEISYTTNSQLLYHHKRVLIDTQDYETSLGIAATWEEAARSAVRGLDNDNIAVSSITLIREG